jgi:uncharacterized protein (TIGR02271 family)
MDHVLLAVFDNARAAAEARTRLLAAGFADDAVAPVAGGERALADDRFGMTVRVSSEAELGRAEELLNGAELQSVPVVEERLDVDKRTVAGGTVRVASRVVEAPAEATVRLREERAGVERQAADRPATETDLAAFEEGVLEIREMVEVAVVRKSARVVEEVSVSRRISHRQQIVRDTVRRTEVEIERIPAATRITETQR